MRRRGEIGSAPTTSMLPDSASKRRAPLSEVQHNADQTIMRQPKLSYNHSALESTENPLPAPPVSCAPVPTLGFSASTNSIADRGKGQLHQSKQTPFDLMSTDPTFSAVTTKAAPVQEQPAGAEVYAGAEEREPGFAEGPDGENLEDYPQDPQGFLNGLVEGLTFISRDLKTSQFAVGVRNDIGQLSSSASSALSSANAMRGVSALSQVVHRLVIEPLRSAETTLLQQQPSTYGNATDSDAEGSDWWGSRKVPPAERARLRAIEQQKQQRDAQQLRSANASRLPSAFFSKRGERGASVPPPGGGGGSLLPPHSEAGEGDSDEDDESNRDRGGSSSRSGALAGRRRKSGEMGARKLAKTPKGKEGTKDSAEGGSSKSRSSKGETTKAEVGSSIDLRKLAKAKKVQVFKGHGAAVMVVGQKRLVVIEHRPTKLEPHQGVVLWISSLENVAKVEMEIKPGTLNATDVSVSLKVDVKEGDAYVFKLGYKEAGVVVASIYARLHGEEPPPSSAQKQQRGAPKSVGADASGGADADGSSASSSAHRTTSAEDPKTPPGSKSNGGKSGWSSRHKHQSGGGARRSERQSSHRKKRSHRKGPRLAAEEENSGKHGSSSSAAGSASGAAPSSPLGASVSPTVLRGCGAGLHSSPESGAAHAQDPASPNTGDCRSHGGTRGSSSGFGLKLEAALESSAAAATSPPAKATAAAAGSKGHLSSPLRIVLSPSGKGRNLQLQVSSVTTEYGSVCLMGKNAGLSEPSSHVPVLLPAKFAGMLSVGVPPDAVKHKLRSELPHLTDELMCQMLTYASSSSKSEGKSTSGETPAPALVPPAPTAAAAATTDTELSAEEEDSVKKYRGMMKAGVPPQAVDNKMTQDGIARKLIDNVLGIKSAAPKAEAAATTELSAEEEASVKKYRGMMKAGVPPQAVRNKMASESLASRLIDAVCGPLEGATPKSDHNSQKDVVLSEEEEKSCGKFRSMLKAGVPPQAVRNKMAAENLAAKLINSVCGPEHVETGGTESWAGRSGKGGKGSSSSSGGGKGGKGGGGKQSNMLTLHWTPLDFSEEDHKNSVWARGTSSRRASTGGLGSNSGGGCDSPELKRLELLFSKKPAAAPKAAADDDGDGTGENAQKKKKKQRPKPLERARMQNLAIGLRSFKDMLPASVGEALSTLDAASFSAEQCARLVEMLPVDAEVSAVKKLKQDLVKEAQEASGSSSSSSIVAPVVALEPAEEFVLGFSGVLRPKPKLAVLNLMVTLEPTAREHAANFATVRRALAQVVASDRLASILGEVLRVGNAMNAGTAKGGAQGVTVESLLKLTQTRSVGTGRDSLTVLDYIAETLLKKQTEGDEVRRAAMLDALLSPSGQDAEDDGADDNDEAGDCDASTNATRDATRRCDATQAAFAEDEEADGDGLVEAAPLDFWRELPDLEAASRLPIAELSAQVVSLRAALGTASREHAKLEDEAKKEAEAQSESQQVPAAAATAQGTTAATGQVLARKVGKLKLPQAADGGSSASADPRAGLMAMLKARGAAADQEQRTESASITPAAPVSGANKGDEVAAATREVPSERASADDDEATAVAATKAAADAAGLRTTSFLAADPRAGLMAALKARRAQDDDDDEEGGGLAKAPSTQREPTATSPAAAPAPVSNKPSPVQSVMPANKVCATGKAAIALGEFLNGAESLVASLEKEAASTKTDADGMALFFGERGQDPGHIFDCLRKFSAMTREAKSKAEAKMAEQQRKQRIADAEAKALANGGAKTLKKKPASDHKADIDPKAGLMSEIRRRSENP